MASGRNSRWIKKFIIIAVILILIAVIATWYVFSKKFDDTATSRQDYSVNALDLIHEFEKNDSLANVKYAEKIITVNGRISGVEAADTMLNLKMTEPASGSYIIFAFQKEGVNLHQVHEGDSVAIKGSCSGGAYSNIMEVEYITFKRCVLNK